MYAIMSIVYGVVWQADSRPVLDEAVEEEIEGFESPYNGGGDGWSYFGVEQGSFDECDTYEVAKLALTLDPATKAAYDRQFAALDSGLQAHITALGPPRLWIVPSTS